MTSRTAVLVGNPKPASRTLAAALHVARELTTREPDVVVDLATLGTRVLDWADEEVQSLVTHVAEADLVVVASPRAPRRRLGGPGPADVRHERVRHAHAGTVRRVAGRHGPGDDGMGAPDGAGLRTRAAVVARHPESEAAFGV